MNILSLTCVERHRGASFSHESLHLKGENKAEQTVLPPDGMVEANLEAGFGNKIN